MEKGFCLTNENYYSEEANERYMSVHQYLDFVGHLGVRGCEARAMARLKGKYQEPKSTALMVGSYVDSYFEGTLEQFKEENPSLFTQKGELKAEFKKAEKMIARAKRDKLFMQALNGDKQVIMTANLFGCDWKIKMDAYQPGVLITDLKTTTDLHKAWRVADYGFVSVPEYWGYTLQGAIYQKVVEINTGYKLPFYLAFITKDEEPELCLVGFSQMELDNALNEIEMNMASVLAVKNGQAEPIRCEKCAYCRSTKVLDKVISMQDLIEE